MSWRDSLAGAQARLVALEAAELRALAGQAIRAITYTAQKVEYQETLSLPALQRAIAETRIIISRFGGGRQTGGRITPVLRG